MKTTTEPTTMMPGTPGPTVCDAIEEVPVAYVEMDAHGVIMRANRAARAAQSLEDGDLAGKFAWDLMPTDEKEQSRTAFFWHMKSGEEPPVVRRSIFTRSGEFRTYEVYRSLIRDGQGRPAGMRALTLDVTDAHNAQAQALQDCRWLESVLESLPEALIVTDALGFVRTMNHAAEQLTGWKAGELIGKVIDQELPMLSYASASNKSFSAHMVLDRPSKGIATLLDRERREMRVEIVTSPIVDKEQGFTTGVVSVLRRVDAGQI